jgi:hypothetical protein
MAGRTLVHFERPRSSESYGYVTRRSSLETEALLAYMLKDLSPDLYKTLLVVFTSPNFMELRPNNGGGLLFLTTLPNTITLDVSTFTHSRF